MSDHSSRRPTTRKPTKLDQNWREQWGLESDFPLFPHWSQRWAKKVRRRLHYFGKIADDPKGEAARRRWLEQKDDLRAGHTPRAQLDGLTLRELCNQFLASKRPDVDLGKLSPRTFVEYSRTTDLLIDTFGRDRLVLDLRPGDFAKLYAKLAKKHGLTTLGREVTMVRSVFKFAVESDLIERAVKFGPRFKSPSKADKRKQRAKKRREHGNKMFQPDEVRAMLAAAGPQLKAMVLLGINCGLGNTDCASLPLSALDLKGGWLDFPRVKTGIERKIPLWTETLDALKAVIANRRPPRDQQYAGLVFLTRLGQPWVRYALAETKDESGRVNVTGRADDAVAKSTAKLLTTLGIKRPGLSFYALRHTVETIGGGCGDQVAVDHVMGHVDETMSAEYRERIEDDRLRAVVNHIHRWLYTRTATKSTPGKAQATKGGKPSRKEGFELRVVG